MGIISVTVTTADSPYSVGCNIPLILLDSSSGPITLLLPLAKNATNKPVRFIKTSTDSNIITFTPTGPDVIDQKTTFTFIDRLSYTLNSLGEGNWAIFNGNPKDYVNAKDFCTADGVTDDHDGIMAAIATANVLGTGVIFSGGTFVSKSDLDPQNSNICLRGELGATIKIIPDGAGEIRGIIPANAPSSNRLVAGSITAGTTAFFASTAGLVSDLVVNDPLLIYTLDPNYNDTVAIDFCEVKSVSGTTVNTLRPILTSFNPSAGQTIQFQKMNANGATIGNLEISGLTLELDASTVTTQCTLLSLYWLNNVNIHNNTFVVNPNTSQPSNFVAMFRSRNVKFYNNHLQIKGSGNKYGIVELAESTDWKFSGNTFEAINSSTNQISVVINFGSSRFQFVDNHINNPIDFGILGYAGPNNGLIAGNVIGLVSGLKTGIGITGGNNLTICDNILLGPTTAGGSGISLSDDSAAATTVVSSSNTVFNNKIGTKISFTNSYDIANTKGTILYQEGTWTPIATNLTQVGGAATLTGSYVRHGKQVFYNIKITPATNTSASTNSTTVTLPIDPASGYGNGFGVAVDEAMTVFGGVLIGNGAFIFTPTWTTINQPIHISGSYYSA